MAPIHTLRRNYSSTFTLIPEDRAIDANETMPNGKDKKLTEIPIKYLIVKLILLWPFILLQIFANVLQKWMRLTVKQRILIVPTFILTTWLWILVKILEPPVQFVKHIIMVIFTPVEERNRQKRTILLSGGSTIQTLHMARNFYSSGARVVVFDFEGVFGLARFSTAVSKFYTVPKPKPDAYHAYISALCDIVEKEKPSHYVPVCATSPALYDSLAKPHLELLGCSSFLPGAQEVSVLDDMIEVIKKCRFYGIPLPPHRILTSNEDLYRLYEIGWMGNYRNILIAGGKQGIVERNKFILPQARNDVNLTHEISDEKQWAVIRDPPGDHFVTCTTVKDSSVIANVTCSVNTESRNLVPEENEDVENWVKNFFTKVKLQRPISGHISFRLVRCDQSGQLLLLGVRVGVSLPYICYTGVHSKILYKPCPHFTRKNSGPLLEENGRYWMPEAIMKTLKSPTVNSVGKLIGTVLDKREALFVYWDPLPYLAYYHFQLPFKSVKTFLQKRKSSRGMTNPLTAPVH